jgi:hypothetical protein
VQTGSLQVDPARTRNVRISDLDVESGTFFPDWDETGAEIPTRIARVTARPAKAGQDMELHFKEALSIGFDDDALPPTVQIYATPIDRTLQLIEMAVRRTFETLEPFLAQSPRKPPAI